LATDRSALSNLSTCSSLLNGPRLTRKAPPSRIVSSAACIRGAQCRPARD
jgi:hypothetical protein